MHKKNIKKVQIETVKIITETQKVIESLIEIEKNIKKENRNEEKTLSYTHLTEHKEMLNNEKQKLDNLEYVVAVVGTMKAGKSMTINAIVGQEVLPSREFPMTTLPTLITHKPKQETPLLKLKKTEPFVKLVKDIKAKKETSKTSEQSDMQELMKKISKDDISFKTSYEGQEQIESFLKEINDLMRIAKDFGIEPPYNDFTDVDDLPRIEVEFYHLAKEENNSNAKLTLLDTPGPDEFKHSALLKEIFKNQLQRASAVMLLVDYTKMNSQSDVEVKEQVKDVADMIGKQHLFVLLNKFDQRKRSDDVEEKKNEAKRLIAEDVLKGQIDKKNIYPISSKSAFYANFGLRELSKNGKIDTSLPWINDFGVTLMAEDWEDDIDDTKRVKKKCEKTWEKSFFQEPLDNIIATIHSDALFLSLKSPLDKLTNLLREYSNAFKTRKNAYQKELSELKNIIETLKEDINKLVGISEGIKESVKKSVKTIEATIKEESEGIIKEIEKSVKDKLISHIKRKKKEEKDRKNEGHKVDDDSFWHQELWEGGLLDILKKSEKSKNTSIDELIEKGKLTYRNKSEAEKVITEINDLFVNVLKASSSIIEKNTNKRIAELSNNINDGIKNKLGDLLTKIEQKFSEEGDSLTIDLPQLNINLNMESEANLSASMQREEETYTVKGDGIWNGFKNFLNSDWGRVEKTRDLFVIEKDEIITNIEKALEEMQKLEISKLTKTFDDTIKKPINDKLQLLTEEIESYRAEQIDILNEREKNNKKSLEQEVELNEKQQKKITILNTRVEESKKILGTNNE